MKKFIAIAVVAIMALGLVACGGKKEETPTDEPVAEQTDMEYVKEKGTLVVGITDFAPMDYTDENGEWIGFDADLARAFAESIGVEVEFVEIDWDNKILELNDKKVDCIWNGMTLTDEVKSSMACSNPYCNNYQVVVLPADVADQYPDIESLKDLTLAVEAGSAGLAEAEANELSYVEVQSQAQALLEVAGKTAGGAIIDSLMAGAMVGPGTDYDSLVYTIGLNIEEGEQYGVGFRQGSDLMNELNAFFMSNAGQTAIYDLAETYGIQAAIVEQP